MRDKNSLVIFDCDGVLVETEQLANQLLTRLLNEEGLDIDYATCRREFVGTTLEFVQQRAEALLGRALGSDWPNHVRDETEKVFRAGVDAVPFVREQVELLNEQGMAFCVASSGRISKMQLTLGKSGLLPLLKDVLFSAEMVGKGKPAPDLFLFAAEEMGVIPHQCVVIEDSVPGVQASVAAGMKVFGYTGDPHTDSDALKKAGATLFDDMRSLPALLELD